ncbi:uncharacterized protein [Engystomops pustulosus]|uniref:uncharacterized protein isoform X2 n=1 Tax=Engystomops pustulosus TaxID=76066 RepID=UPI003AFA8ED5
MPLDGIPQGANRSRALTDTPTHMVGEGRDICVETMEKAEAILNHTLEMICLLTVEDYIIVKRATDEDKCTYSLCAAEIRNGATDPPVTSPDLSFTLLGIQDSDQKKILELANKIIGLLTCEVPLKCQDVAVYFSKDEWEYLEGHGEHYDYKQMTEARDPDPINQHDAEHVIPAEPCIKQEPDTGDYGDVPPVVSVGCVLPCAVKSEPMDVPEEPSEDPSRTDFSQFPSVLVPISKEPEETFAAPLSALDNNFIDNETMRSEIIYQITVTNKRRRKSKSGAKPNPCGMCKKRFSTKASLSRHMKMHTGKGQYPCDVCGKKFSCKNHVQTHHRIHTGERPFSCAECGRRFTNHSHLVLHKVVHTKEKPYTCPVCGKRFTRQSSVVKHSGMHAEKKPHVCQDCGKSYCQYANLVVHRRLHSGEKPFTCRHCEQGFACKATMLRHELSHTGEKPFSCPQCDKCFFDNSTLNKHKRKVHAKESEKS